MGIRYPKQTTTSAVIDALTNHNYHGFKPQELANTAWAFATLNKPLPQALIDALTNHNYQGFKPQTSQIPHGHAIS